MHPYFSVLAENILLTNRNITDKKAWELLCQHYVNEANATQVIFFTANENEEKHDFVSLAKSFIPASEEVNDDEENTNPKEPFSLASLNSRLSDNFNPNGKFAHLLRTFLTSFPQYCAPLDKTLLTQLNIKSYILLDEKEIDAVFTQMNNGLSETNVLLNKTKTVMPYFKPDQKEAIYGRVLAKNPLSAKYPQFANIPMSRTPEELDAITANIPHFDTKQRSMAKELISAGLKSSDKEVGISASKALSFLEPEEFKDDYMRSTLFQLMYKTFENLADDLYTDLLRAIHDEWMIADEHLKNQIVSNLEMFTTEDEFVWNQRGAFKIIDRLFYRMSPSQQAIAIQQTFTQLSNQNNYINSAAFETAITLYHAVSYQEEKEIPLLSSSQKKAVTTMLMKHLETKNDFLITGILKAIPVVFMDLTLPEQECIHASFKQHFIDEGHVLRKQYVESYIALYLAMKSDSAENHTRNTIFSLVEDALESKSTGKILKNVAFQIMNGMYPDSSATFQAFALQQLIAQLSTNTISNTLIIESIGLQYATMNEEEKQAAKNYFIPFGIEYCQDFSHQSHYDLFCLMYSSSVDSAQNALAFIITSLKWSLQHKDYPLIDIINRYSLESPDKLEEIAIDYSTAILSIIASLHSDDPTKALMPSHLLHLTDIINAFLVRMNDTQQNYLMSGIYRAYREAQGNSNHATTLAEILLLVGSKRAETLNHEKLMMEHTLINADPAKIIGQYMQ